MVRRVIALALLIGACRENRPAADRVEMPPMDSTVMSDPMQVDRMLDTMPGGEMARGNDAATVRFVRSRTTGPLND